ncbi:MAG TPA: hypothetical protein VK533_03745 [Sphingomonas sp.]|uniref:hypothetical protein n=1 Tax=Sphingomonas sp. TaxID=28214 RepID=UPI002C04FBDD|nr:hypothetical protein [Sphingomonas sp.]HMI18636.1 hypothetical protein [Sphingomonas sp.]
MGAEKGAVTTAMEGRSRASAPWFVSAFLLFGATLAMRFPGVAMYDSVAQYEQAVDGTYADWHPPIMARTWSLLLHLHSGSAPFFFLQMLFWWGGLALISAAFGRRAKHGPAALVLLVGIAPLWLGWATVILKDAQMACCLVGAAGLVAHWRLDERPLPRWALALALLLIAYATLVRGNAVFATIPFAFALFDWPRLPKFWHKGAAVLAVIGAVLIINPLLNLYFFRAEHTGVENSLPLYDAAGIAHLAHLQTLPGLAPEGWARAEQKGCYTPYFWNPYGEDAQCGFVGDAVIFDHLDDRRMMAEWAGLVAHHPLAYAEHRIGHFNANLRFWVGPGEPDANPPLDSEPNHDGLGVAPNPGGEGLIAAAKLMAVSPLGWPFAWAIVAAGLLWASTGLTGPQVRLGRALALSALCMSASFALVSIASDLRYHLWSMVAAALALILLADTRALDRRRSFIAGGVLIGAIALGTVARLGLAAPVYVPLPAASPPPAPLTAH